MHSGPVQCGEQDWLVCPPVVPLRHLRKVRPGNTFRFQSEHGSGRGLRYGAIFLLRLHHLANAFRSDEFSGNGQIRAHDGNPSVQVIEAKCRNIRRFTPALVRLSGGSTLHAVRAPASERPVVYPMLFPLLLSWLARIPHDPLSLSFCCFAFLHFLILS